METRVLIVCITVGFLGILAAVFGFAAEATRIKASDLLIDDLYRCVYPTSAATGLGATAFVALFIAQITITIFSGCGCCGRNGKVSNTNVLVPRLLAGFSWLTFIAASGLLLSASVTNNQHNGETDGRNVYCSITKGGLFAGGAVLSIVTIALSIGCYYLISRSSFSSNMNHTNQAVGPNHAVGIPMGQPKVPPQGTYPPV